MIYAKIYTKKMPKVRGVMKDEWSHNLVADVIKLAVSDYNKKIPSCPDGLNLKQLENHNKKVKKIRKNKKSASKFFKSKWFAEICGLTGLNPEVVKSLAGVKEDKRGRSDD